MIAPLQKIAVWKLRDRRSSRPTARPWVVAWKVDEVARSRAFATKAEAEQFRSQLIVARTAGVRFCARTGLPEAMLRPAQTPTVFDWAVRWIDTEWDTAEPRTRLALVESLAWFVAAAHRTDAPALKPLADQRFRRYLRDVLAPAAGGQDRTKTWRPVRNAAFDRRLANHVLRLDELDADQLTRIEVALRTGVDGRPRRVSGQRHVKNAKRCVRRAVDLGVLAADPWPRPKKGEDARKAVKQQVQRRRDEIGLLPNRAQALVALDAMVSHQPSSRQYHVMSRVILDAGLRPSEVIDLAVDALTLPDTGWGLVVVSQADVARAEPGEPKTGERRVPLHPDTVALLRDWCAGRTGFLFRTRSGRRPTLSNWWRCLTGGCARVALVKLSPYDLRHIAATTMVNAGVPIGEAAERLGHSPEELLRTYVHALAGDAELANRRLEAAFAG